MPVVPIGDRIWSAIASEELIWPSGGDADAYVSVSSA